MSRIELHRKYGLNPTIQSCMICGGDRNEIILLGAKSRQFTGREEAPMKSIITPGLCDGCRKKAEDLGGVWLILAEQEAEGGTRLLGKVVMLKRAAMERIMPGFPARRSWVFIEMKEWVVLGLDKVPEGGSAIERKGSAEAPEGGTEGAGADAGGSTG